jgi:hypothetical protein
MPPREDDDLSLLRALVDDLILDVAEGWRWGQASKGQLEEP